MDWGKVYDAGHMGHGTGFKSGVSRLTPLQHLRSTLLGVLHMLSSLAQHFQAAGFS